ncbi:MAG: universal stress protein [Chloroflexi bacterium]|nr:universal stress protein [Chloroflexota bacterium]
MTLDATARLRSLLVPIDDSGASRQALSVACDIVRRGKSGRVLAMHVIEVPRRLPLDAEMIEELEHGERILEHAESLAREQRVDLNADLVQARQAGTAIVDEARERGIDAIVIGIDYHRPHGTFQLGRLPRYALEHAPCEVWLIRYPPEAGLGDSPGAGNDESGAKG